jgi:hypothetical protein
VKPRSLFLSLLLVAVACQPAGPGATRSAATTAPSATVAASSASSGSGEICQALSAAGVASLVGQPAIVDATSSNADTCTFTVGEGGAGAGSYFIALRRERGFEDLATAKEAFAGGQDVPGLADQAYWSQDVDVLWFDTKRVVFAVQLIDFPENQGDALALARAVAEAALPKLSGGS